MSVERISRNGYLGLSGNHLNYFSIEGRESSSSSNTKDTFNDWHENTLDVGDFKVIPFGKGNDIPQRIQEAVLPNSFAHRTLKRKAELLIEQGPYIYTHVIDGRQYYRQPEKSPEILTWLEDIEHEQLLLKQAIDYYFEERVCTKIYRQRSGRLGASEPATIEHISSFKCRPAYKKNDKKKKPTHIIVGDWVKGDQKEMAVYPIFDKKNPDKYPVSIHVSNLPAYGIDEYPVPDILGALDWISNTTQTPKIFKAYMENSLNIKWHIQSPAKFWKDKRDILVANCKAQGTTYKESMLEDLKSKILDQLSEVLSGVENVGKFWHNEYVVSLLGGNAVEQGWKITPIDQKTKDWVESQVKMYDTAIYAMQAGLGLHASLAMVGADGKSNTGSEQYYAYAIHQKTATPIPEMIVTKALNDLIAIKFDSKYKVGFYRTKPEHQQDITNSQRTVPSTTAEDGNTVQ